MATWPGGLSRQMAMRIQGSGWVAAEPAARRRETLSRGVALLRRSARRV
jgi:hypothetical protein